MPKVCIIKGSRFEAAKAAADRGVPLVFIREVGNDTVGKTEADENILNKWFCEDDPRAPFPVGSLLLWFEV
jgi:hypothetical protein